MLYENYQNKILKVAETLKKIIRLLPLIIPAVALVIATVITLLALKGNIGELTCSTEVVYGEQVQCEAKAFLSKVRYEYSSDYSQWTEEAPRLPGTYWVRAVSNASFGGKKYSEPRRYTVSKRGLTVSVAESEIVYGEKLTLRADTAYNDVVVCEKFDSDDAWLSEGVVRSSWNHHALLSSDTVTKRQHQVAPSRSALKVLDENGNDVTSAYEISVATTDISIVKRPVVISVAEISKVYDGTALFGGECTVSGGSLSEGDEIRSSFSATIVDVGSIKNTPAIKIFAANGADVSDYYSIETVIGDLKVTKRPVTVSLDDVTIPYGGEAAFCMAYGNDVDPATPLVEGHSIKCSGGTEIDDCGEYAIETTVDVVNAAGNIVSQNYDIKVNAGTITVTPIDLTYVTPNDSWVYDGNENSSWNGAVKGLLKNNTIKTVGVPYIRDVGTLENKYSIKIYNSKKEVTHNYNITYKYGTLEVTPRYLTVTTKDGYWVYDGEFYSQEDIVQEGDLIPDWQRFETVDVPKIRDFVENGIPNQFEIKILDDYSYEKEGWDVTSNYVISYNYGTLEIGKREVAFSTEDQSWKYDGEAHSWKEYYPTSPLTIVDGEKLEITGWASITDVGSRDNDFEAFMITRTEDGATTDISFNYNVDWKYGTIEIEPRPISCKPVDADKVYDGTPLVATEIELAESTEYDLVEGHYLEATYGGSITDAGIEESYLIDVIVRNENGENISYNYDVEKLTGILEIHRREITVYTESAVKDRYDGTPLTCKVYGLYDDKLYDLVKGHKIYVKVIGSQTEIGESDNNCDEEYTYILSGTRNVTANYDIKYEYGKLLVRPEAFIYVTSASDWKYFDGTPLTNPDYEFSVREGSLNEAEGHTLVVEVTGSITDIGSCKNTMSAYIVDRSGRDVSNKYIFVLSEGTLEIKEKTDTPSPKPEIVVGQIKAGKSGYIYLRERSYGNYNGSGWNAATAYWNTLPGGLSYNYLTSIALANYGQTADEAEMLNMMIYMLPYYLGMSGDYEMPSVDTEYHGERVDFNLTYYYMPTITKGYDFLKGYLGEYAAYEKEYRKFVYDNYRTIDKTTREYMQGIIDENGFDISDPMVVQKIASYIQNAAKYNLNYDTLMDSAPNVAIAFLDQYKEGICVHYASAATLLYRTLGIPARYVEGFTVQTVAGQYVDIKTPGHAWVEVYIDEIGWVEVEVTGSDGSGGNGQGSGPLKQAITVKPAYRFKFFDGDPLVPSGELDAQGVLAELIAQGYTYSITVDGSQTEVGRGVSTVVDFRLFDPEENDVTEEFIVKYEDGVLEVLPPETQLIRVYLYQLQKYYDGTPLFFEREDYEIIEIPDGVRLELEFNVSLTSVGSLSLSALNEGIDEFVTYRVYKDDKEVTENYVLMFDTFEYGDHNYIPIRVDARPITVTSASDTMVFNGSVLANDGYDITKGSLVDGHRIEVTVSGYIDKVGATTNTIDSIVIYDDNNNDVTENYRITAILGMLTVIPGDD